jgi:4Fe-4S dicluster domain
VHRVLHVPGRVPRHQGSRGEQGELRGPPDVHPLDTLDRRKMAQRDEGLGYCNITKCCTEVCPESIHITENAIIPLKERVVDSYYDPVAWLGRKIRRRGRRAAG